MMSLHQNFQIVTLLHLRGRAIEDSQIIGSALSWNDPFFLAKTVLEMDPLLHHSDEAALHLKR